MALVAALLAAGCTHGGDDGDEPSRALTLVRGEIEAPYVAGDRLGSKRLAAPISTTLIANLAPAAVPDPSGERVAYNSWRGNRPLVRVAGDRDTVVAEGAYAPAWRRDGALAYVQALEPELPGPEAIRGYRGHVVVRGRLETAPRRWTEAAGRYVVAAWADERLLAYRITTGWPELLVLDAPGRVRVLARDAALVAVAPDGSRVFVSTYGATPPLVRVLDVEGGRELARRTVPAVRWLVEAGSWRDGHVAAGSSVGVALFRVSERGIWVEQLLRLDRVGFTTGVFEPQLDERGRVTAWGELESRPRQTFAGAAVVECDLAERRCVHGPELSSAVAPRLVYDPSRP
ncbi:MAG: hypothetical protein ACRDNX_08440 [Gaiellaceae bacterium]